MQKKPISEDETANANFEETEIQEREEVRTPFNEQILVPYATSEVRMKRSLFAGW